LQPELNYNKILKLYSKIKLNDEIIQEFINDTNNNFKLYIEKISNKNITDKNKLITIIQNITSNLLTFLSDEIIKIKSRYTNKTKWYEPSVKLYNVKIKKYNKKISDIIKYLDIQLDNKLNINIKFILNNNIIIDTNNILKEATTGITTKSRGTPTDEDKLLESKMNEILNDENEIKNDDTIKNIEYDKTIREVLSVNETININEVVSINEVSINEVVSINGTPSNTQTSSISSRLLTFLKKLLPL
jgi:hypothetical protein